MPEYQVYFVPYGHLHHPHAGHVDEHQLGTGDVVPCDPGHACDAHPRDHVHGVGCEHAAVPHDGHIDYVVEGHLHRRHDEHCGDHGALRLAHAREGEA